MSEIDYLIKEFAKLPTGSVSDALGRLNGMAGISPIVKNVKLVGKALTVRTYLGDAPTKIFLPAVAQVSVVQKDVGTH